ncbi:MAG: hypothetical protein LBB41_02320 [Prevotellaceae bacterium]|jgi:hypothetical protein|nr:hypothetical protein [Prevotellaceae bacterium]
MKNINGNPRRIELVALSVKMRHLVKSGQFDSINEALEAFYAQSGHTELHTFSEWHQQNHIIKKGEHALLLWGKPRNSKTETENASSETTENEENGENGRGFYPIAYVFSNLQVKPMSAK